MDRLGHAKNFSSGLVQKAVKYSMNHSQIYFLKSVDEWGEARVQILCLDQCLYVHSEFLEQFKRRGGCLLKFLVGNGGEYASA